MTDSKYHYDKTAFIESLKAVGVAKGDTVFSHSNVGFFGRPKGCNNVVDVCGFLLDCIFEVLGSDGTLIVPTFTYSFSTGMPYCNKTSKTNCGAFSDFVCNHSESLRYDDPNVSVAVIGKKSELFASNAPKDPYSNEGIFARMDQENVLIANMNFDAGSTYLHYLEKKYQVPYRFSKEFIGERLKGGVSVTDNSFLWVRRIEPGTKAQFESFSRCARDEKMFKTKKVGRGFIGAIRCSQAEAVFEKYYSIDPWLLTENSSFLKKLF